MIVLHTCEVGWEKNIMIWFPTDSFLHGHRWYVLLHAWEAGVKYLRWALLCVCVWVCFCEKTRLCMQDFFTTTPEQNKVMKAMMKQLIFEGVVSETEWPRLREKWFKDPNSYFALLPNMTWGKWNCSTYLHVQNFLCRRMDAAQRPRTQRRRTNKQSFAISFPLAWKILSFSGLSGFQVFCHAWYLLAFFLSCEKVQLTCKYPVQHIRCRMDAAKKRRTRRRRTSIF